MLDRVRACVDSDAGATGAAVALNDELDDAEGVADDVGVELVAYDVWTRRGTVFEREATFKFATVWAGEWACKGGAKASMMEREASPWPSVNESR